MADTTKQSTEKPKISFSERIGKIGQILSMTGAGLIDPTAPLKFANFQKQQEDAQREAEFQNAIISQVFGGGGGDTNTQPTSSVPQQIINQKNLSPISIGKLSGTDVNQQFEDFKQQNGRLSLDNVANQLAVTGGKVAGLNIGQDPIAQKKIDIAGALDKAIAENQIQTTKDLTNVQLKIDSNFDSFLDTINAQNEKTKTGAGVIGGTFAKVYGKARANEYLQGFEGGLIEVAAAVGKVSMQGTRAIRLIDEFKKTGISIYDTMESAAQTSADSIRNAISSDMGANPEGYIKGFNDMDKSEQAQARREMTKMLQQFEKDFKDTYLIKAYKKNPELLKPETRARIEKQLFSDETLTKFGLDPSIWELDN